MCTNEKSCITINCGCCGNGSGITPEPAPVSALKYMQLEVDNQDFALNKKMYFNDKSFGDFELTPEGCVKLPAGTYLTYLNFMMVGRLAGTEGYIAVELFDTVTRGIIGKRTARVSASSIKPLSNTEGIYIVKLDQEAEVCLNCYIQLDDSIPMEEIRATILQIA